MQAQLGHLLVLLEAVRDLGHAGSRQLVPRQIQKLKSRVAHPSEDGLEEDISHLAVVSADYLEHLVLIDHFDDAGGHLWRQRVLRKVERVEMVQLHDGFDESLRLVVAHLQLLHLEVFYRAARASEKLFQKLDIFRLD